MKGIGLFAGFLLLALGMHAHTAFAHQPEYIGSETSVDIPDPEISRAYYGELTGVPATFTIASTHEFSLYAGILSPDVSGAKKDFTVTITDATGTRIATLEAPASEWQKWYEEFAGDTYWKGPEFTQTVPGGTYTIVVSNPTNTGKYVLAPGEAEVFTLAGTPQTIRQLYVVKTLFFGKPWYSIFQGIIGKFLAGGVAALVALISVITFFLYKRARNRLQTPPVGG